MKRFNFRLQRVLDVKNTIEEVKRRNFLTASSEHEKRVRILEVYVQTLYKYLDELRTKHKKTLSSQDINLYYNYFESMSRLIEFQKKEIENARVELEKMREELIAAVKDRKIIERLKERQFRNYLKEVDMEEQKHLDEVSGISFFKKANVELN